MLDRPNNASNVLVESVGYRRVLTDSESGPRAGQAGDRLLALVSRG